MTSCILICIHIYAYTVLSFGTDGLEVQCTMALCIYKTQLKATMHEAQLWYDSCCKTYHRVFAYWIFHINTASPVTCMAALSFHFAYICCYSKGQRHLLFSLQYGYQASCNCQIIYSWLYTCKARNSF